MGKTIFITGSTDGIGKLAAARLAKEGHNLILHGRNAEKLEATISELKATSKNESITEFVADFSDLDEVKNAVNEYLKKDLQIDVLINNAGVFKSPISKLANGLDIRFVVNYLSPYLLTDQFIPLLKESSHPRIINLSSAAQAAVSMDALTGNIELSTQEAYAQSKLALTMWSFYLANKHKDIQVFPVNPGSLLNTKMVQEAFGRYWSSAEKGASILAELAVSEKYHQISGEYFDNDSGGFGRAHADAYNSDKINQLISTTEELLKQE